jgi:hypothetical protein
LTAVRIGSDGRRFVLLLFDSTSFEEVEHDLTPHYS